MRFHEMILTPLIIRPWGSRRKRLLFKIRKQIESQTPLGRIGKPQDIAPTAVFLASEDSAWLTGETFLITGGLR
jgi:NAD(P)-dependent dehydrogenase (short-subunit alcohol dehydrogenase family)